MCGPIAMCEWAMAPSAAAPVPGPAPAVSWAVPGDPDMPGIPGISPGISGVACVAGTPALLCAAAAAGVLCRDASAAAAARAAPRTKTRWRCLVMQRLLLPIQRSQVQGLTRLPLVLDRLQLAA